MTNITRRAFSGGVAMISSLRATASFAQTDVTPAEARAIAKEAYIYGFEPRRVCRRLFGLSHAAMACS
jgi:hypothetical protein